MFDNDKFIQLVHAIPALWEKGCKEYSLRTNKDCAWVSVAVDMSEGDTWDNLTDSERQEEGKRVVICLEFILFVLAYFLILCNNYFLIESCCAINL